MIVVNKWGSLDFMIALFIVRNCYLIDHYCLDLDH